MEVPAKDLAGNCCGCGAAFPGGEGPIHRYMSSSPGCWAAFGVVLTREYGDRAYARFHRLSVDAYAVQHPGSPSPETIQSVAVHLCRLCIIVEGGLSIERANEAMLAIHQVEGRFRWLEPPPSRGPVTVADVLAAQGVDEHLRQVERWARSCWEAWSGHHATIRGWVPTARTSRPTQAGRARG